MSIEGTVISEGVELGDVSAGPSGDQRLIGLKTLPDGQSGNLCQTIHGPGRPNGGTVTP